MFGIFTWIWIINFGLKVSLKVSSWMAVGESCERCY